MAQLVIACDGDVCWRERIDSRVMDIRIEGHVLKREAVAGCDANTFCNLDEHERVVTGSNDDDDQDGGRGQVNKSRDNMTNRAAAAAAAATASRVPVIRVSPVST